MSSVFIRVCVTCMPMCKNNKKHKERPEGLEELQDGSKMNVSRPVSFVRHITNRHIKGTKGIRVERILGKKKKS